MDTSGLRLTNSSSALSNFWHPVARSAEVDFQPRRVVLLGVAYVIYRGIDGLVAFVDRCAHRLAPLSIGHCEGDSSIRCAYHGWLFDRSGKCIDIPALGPGVPLPIRARLERPHSIVERFGMIFIAPKAPIADLPEVEVAGDAHFMVGEIPPVRARASAGIMVDNFLDIAHFPFVHAATFGAEESTYVEPYSAEQIGTSAVLSYEHLFANREDQGVATGIRPLLQRRRMTYRYFAPFSVTLRLDFLDSGGTNLIGFFVQPVDDQYCCLYSTLWRDDLAGDEGKMKEAIEFELKVLEEDLAIQAAYEELTFPIDTSIEIHTRADRLTLLMRRILGELIGSID